MTLRQLTALIVAAVFMVMGGHAAAQSPAAPPDSLVIAGGVPTSLTLALKDLRAMERQTVTVTQSDGTKMVFEGVSLTAILTRAGVTLGRGMPGSAIASYIVAKGSDGYQAVFAYAEVDPALSTATIVVADQVNGKPLPDGQGPLRLITSHDKLGSRHVRMLGRIELVQLVR